MYAIKCMYEYSNVHISNYIQPLCNPLPLQEFVRAQEGSIDDDPGCARIKALQRPKLEPSFKKGLLKAKRDLVAALEAPCKKKRRGQVKKRRAENDQPVVPIADLRGFMRPRSARGEQFLLEPCLSQTVPGALHLLRLWILPLVRLRWASKWCTFKSLYKYISHVLPMTPWWASDYFCPDSKCSGSSTSCWSWWSDHRSWLRQPAAFHCFYISQCIGC